MLETGKAEALLEDIVGPQKYIKEVLQLESLSVRAKDGRVITWHTASSPLKQVRDKYRGH